MKYFTRRSFVKVGSFSTFGFWAWVMPYGCRLNRQHRRAVTSRSFICG